VSSQENSCNLLACIPANPAHSEANRARLGLHCDPRVLLYCDIILPLCVMSAASGLCRQLGPPPVGPPGTWFSHLCFRFCYAQVAQIPFASSIKTTTSQPVALFTSYDSSTNETTLSSCLPGTNASLAAALGQPLKLTDGISVQGGVNM
jgi:hypothetical protein